MDLVKPGNRNCFKRKDSLERDCKACGKISMIDPKHKLYSFIVKNPPDNKKGKNPLLQLLMLLVVVNPFPILLLVIMVKEVNLEIIIIMVVVPMVKMVKMVKGMMKMMKMMIY